MLFFVRQKFLFFLFLPYIEKYTLIKQHFIWNTNLFKMKWERKLNVNISHHFLLYTIMVNLAFQLFISISI